MWYWRLIIVFLIFFCVFFSLLIWDDILLLIFVVWVCFICWIFFLFFKFFKCVRMDFIDFEREFIFFLCILSLRFIFDFIVLNLLLILVRNLFLNLFNLFLIIDCKDCWFFCNFWIVLVIIVILFIRLLFVFVLLFELVLLFVIFIVFVDGFGVFLLEECCCFLLFLFGFDINCI